MRVLHLSRIGLLASAIGLAATAYAEDTTTSTQGELSTSTGPRIGGTQQLTQAESIQRRGGTLSERISKMLGEARRDKDILRANCLNRKLTECNAASGSVSARVAAIRSALANGDSDRANHEFTVLAVLSEKYDAIEQEVGQCIGQGSYQAGGASSVTTIIPSNAPTIVPGVLPAPPPPPPAVSLPPPFSPTM